MKKNYSKLFILLGVLICILAFSGCAILIDDTETVDESEKFSEESRDVLSDEEKNTNNYSVVGDTENTDEEETEETAEEGLVPGTYYLPYIIRYYPTSLSFDENGNYEHSYYNDKTESERGRYEALDGKVILEADDGSRFYVYSIFKNRIVLEGFTNKKENLGGDLWSYEIPLVYFLPGASESEILAATVKEYDNSKALPTIERIYGEYEYEKDSYIQKAYAFMVGKSNGGNPHGDWIINTDYTFAYGDEREIMVYAEGRIFDLDVAYLQNIITEDDLKALFESHRNCNIAHCYNEGVIVQNPSGTEEILYTCTLCGATKAVSMPDDFSFALTWSFDGYYNSETGHMENGYNYTLGTKCETTMYLTRRELLDIYRLFNNGEIFDITENFYASDALVEPSYLIEISYKINGQETGFKIGGASYGTYRDWEVHPELGYYYEKIVEDYILNSEEYKSMPRNEKLYE